VTIPDRPLRALFVNSGFLGHASVLRLMRRVGEPLGIRADFVDLSADLSTGERLLRRVLCAGPSSGAAFPGASLLLPRPRHELHSGIQAARRIRALERRGGRWDVIHFHTQATAYASLGRMRRTPSVVSLDATQPLALRAAAYPAARAEYGVSAALDRRVFRRAAAIVPVSRWAAEGVAAEVPECAKRVRVLPYPAPVERFPAPWAEARAARDPSSPVTLLFMGGDFPRKGGRALLDAWRDSELADRARLVLATDWPIGELPPGVEQRRGIRGYTPEWDALWREADVFVLPTRDEAFGMVYQEAAAAGVPAIGSRINAVPEIVEDGGTGLLVDPMDVAALIQAIRTLVDSPGLRRRMGAAARRRAEDLWPEARYAASLAELLRAAAAEGAPA
jgi:alpha-maltose-1-phosphate synthase